MHCVGCEPDFWLLPALRDRRSGCVARDLYAACREAARWLRERATVRAASKLSVLRPANRQLCGVGGEAVAAASLQRDIEEQMLCDIVYFVF